VVRGYSASAAGAGASMQIAAAAQLGVICVFIALLIRQVPTMAAGLAAGMALSTYSAVSRTIDWGLGAARKTGYEGMRGAMDGLRGEPISRWDSLRRGGGNLIGAGVRRMLGRGSSGGAVVPRERVMPPPSKR
jgi:type IV secretion system protein VirB6